MTQANPTPFEVIGEALLYKLIDVFYDNVSRHPELQPIFPEELSETVRKQKQFMAQYLGGPSLYTEEHGHPMLRARHLPFEITPSRAEAWLSCMRQAMDTVGLVGDIREFYYHRLHLTAQHMINTTDQDMKGEEN
ncbi:globin [Peribacillus loiseleuriae]|uniref:Globin n=1 Tax=Peribacillus loiseleuriae TaxID=1679170 RepID=A0A0K9GR21_9BACI|nr:globin [Peribacillus loiseleuriae]KMY49100.1 globin [Peribacillus loiseleuriae]